MPDTITLTSTTDTEADVRGALGLVSAEAPKTSANESAKGAAGSPEVEAGQAVEPEDEAAVEATNAQQVAAGKRRGRLQSRIDELVGERDQERGNAAALRAEIDAYRRRLGEVATTQPTKAAQAPVAEAQKPRPDIKDFANYEDYTEAVADWKVDTKAAVIAKQMIDAELRAERERVATAQMTQAQNHLRTKWEAGAEAARAKYEDFDEVINDPAVKGSDLTIDQLRRSEHGAEVAYYLGSHPDVAQKLFALGNTPDGLKEFGKIEARVEDALEAAAAPTAARTAPAARSAAPVAPPAGDPAAVTTKAARAQPVTKAPDPITPVGAGDTATVVDPDKMPYQDYVAWRNASLRKRAGLK